MVGCSAKVTDPASLYTDQPVEKIFKDGQHAMLKGNYDDAKTHFQAIDARYPFSNYARQSQLDLIYTFYQMQDTASALAQADLYIHMYPRGPYVDYAYYMRGLINFYANHGFFEKYFNIDFANRDLDTLHKAYLDFSQLNYLFPKSVYSADARQRMVYIKNAFARHDLLVAQYYYKRKLYIAAANRANEVVQHYQETPSVPDALALMVKSYQKLNLTKDADETLQVLRLNFPDYKKV